MKLLRPLHRQRTRRRHHRAVLDSAGLYDYFAHRGTALACPAELEAHLKARGIAYHRDSQGEIWASLPVTEL